METTEERNGCESTDWFRSRFWGKGSPKRMVRSISRKELLNNHLFNSNFTCGSLLRCTTCSDSLYSRSYPSIQRIPLDLGSPSSESPSVQPVLHLIYFSSLSLRLVTPIGVERYTRFLVSHIRSICVAHDRRSNLLSDLSV